MLKFFTSLTFLYAFTIVVMLVYGFLFYKNFSRNRYQDRRFPLVFSLISLACFSFLFFNINAPLALKTFSNLDHHFIKHEGFAVAKKIELGRADTVNYKASCYNSFVLQKENGLVKVSSTYSEEPLYVSSGSSYQLFSANFPAQGHQLSLRADTILLSIKSVTDTSFSLSVNNITIATAGKTIRRGITGWNIFKDNLGFINSEWYTNENVVKMLQSIMLLRDNVSRTKGEELKYFLSGKLFEYSTSIMYNNTLVSIEQIAFTKTVEDKSIIAWGISFLDNNKNQYQVSYLSEDSFALVNRYPISYPLTEEKKGDWTGHSVNKFLVSAGKDIQQVPGVFSEGFMFANVSEDNKIGFAPVLLTYQKGSANTGLALQAKFLSKHGAPLTVVNNRFSLPAASDGFSWVFSIYNSFDWSFGAVSLTAKNWKLLIFCPMFFFSILVLGSSLIKPANLQSWIWQLLSCVALVLLTTRFFLYWRYKAFPPYEGLDLPSLQQLNSFWNFGIVVLVAIILALVFGFSFLKYIYSVVRKQVSSFLKLIYKQSSNREPFFSKKIFLPVVNRIPVVKNWGAKSIFFASWILVLLAGGGLAAVSSFNPATCRHLAIALVLLYFLFLYISYRHSPLVATSEKCWWGLSTAKPLDVIINNPVKILLSISLLGLFAFVDIGFAIVFLNFLLFNEAFLCINYAIAGLSTGRQKNASRFGVLGIIYLVVFILNLVYGSYLFKYILELPQILYLPGYVLFAILISYAIIRLLYKESKRTKLTISLLSVTCLFAIAFLFFPKERIISKAAMTKYRIDVMTIPVDKAIEIAYEDGKTYEPVIRAAQNQWFINTFIYEKNNPGVNSVGFNLLPHAPQNKGAKYNAQATDLVASRFFIAEHGKWSVLLYVLLLLVPVILLASFYKLYPDFTNRVNNYYPTITLGFCLLNYLLITALLVILAATGRYIFFGQDLPFASILSKQSILFPALIIVLIVSLFKHIPLELYPNNKKFMPGAILFAGLAFLLFLVKPLYNKDNEFGATNLANEMDTYVQARLQPLVDFFDSSKHSRRLTIASKDRLFADSVRKLFASGFMEDAGSYFKKEVEAYALADFSRHLDQRRMLYLDLYSGKPQLAVNENYFRIDPPPHLQQYWTGHVFGDSSIYNISTWNASSAVFSSMRINNNDGEVKSIDGAGLQLVYRKKNYNSSGHLYMVNTSATNYTVINGNKARSLVPHDSLVLNNPYKVRVTNSNDFEMILVAQPDAFMKNYFVNGSRYYVYPDKEDFIWARNFAESISSDYTSNGESARNAFVSIDAMLMDSLTAKINSMLNGDTAYRNGAEYGICIADGNGRVVAMPDYIKGLNRPDPNDKVAFNTVVRRDNGFVPQSLLRKKVGNINLLRMNPGPGSTLKPIVFSAIASQLSLDWDAFATEGFSQKQTFFGGEKVAEYDFEKNNGRISTVADYLRYSDNYYHSNVLLLGSYSKQGLKNLLLKHFAKHKPAPSFHWPYFSYNGNQYWLNGFKNWPGYLNGKANFGSDSSFVSAGLFNNYGIYTYHTPKASDKFSSTYDSSLFHSAYKKSGFILPEYALFDQKGTGMDNGKPNEVFMSSFRGHVKGSSQVMIPPLKMLDVFGKLVSQNKDYALTLNPYATDLEFNAFDVDNSVSYNKYLAITKDKIFVGLRQALFNGTAARLGALLKNGSPYYYYAKTGTTGDDAANVKSKLFVIIISEKDITSPDFNFRKNKFYTIYFTSQNGPAKQNEELQATIIKMVQESEVFRKYMKR